MELRGRPEDAAAVDTGVREEPPQGEVPQGRVAAVVPAAGCGTRMDIEMPKQYLEVCGRPLVTHCLEALQGVPWISKVVVVADDVERMREVVRASLLSKVTVIEGGGSRHRSIRAGVEDLARASDPPAVVVVHDGVRPLLPLATLTQVAVAAERHGAAGAVRPLVSTVVKPDSEGFLQESLVRSLYLNSEMPQAFRVEVLTEAYRRCSEEELDYGTECLALALRHAGVRAKLVPGTPQLWKVTEERDLVVARALLPRHIRTITVVCRALAPSLPRDTAPAASSCTASLTCGHECLRVFATLEDSLRRSCRQIDFACNYAYPVTQSSSVVVIANITSPEALLEHLRPAAEGLDTRLGTTIFIFNLLGQAAPDVTLLQRRMREELSERPGPVTVILRGAGEGLTDATTNQGASEGRGKEDRANQNQTEKKPQTGDLLENSTHDCGQLPNLVMSLLDQTTRSFHGLLLVL